MHQVGRVGQVAVVELQADSALVPVAIDVVDPLGVEAGRPSDDPVHFVPLWTHETNTGRGGRRRHRVGKEYLGLDIDRSFTPITQ